jgi:hypothetical protein
MNGLVGVIGVHGEDVIALRRRKPFRKSLTEAPAGLVEEARPCLFDHGPGVVSRSASDDQHLEIDGQLAQCEVYIRKERLQVLGFVQRRIKTVRSNPGLPVHRTRVPMSHSSRSDSAGIAELNHREVAAQDAAHETAELTRVRPAISTFDKRRIIRQLIQRFGDGKIRGVERSERFDMIGASASRIARALRKPTSESVEGGLDAGRRDRASGSV